MCVTNSVIKKCTIIVITVIKHKKLNWIIKAFRSALTYNLAEDRLINSINNINFCLFII